MCKAMKDRINDEKLKISYNLLLLGTISKEDIAKATKLPIEKINKLEGNYSVLQSKYSMK